MKKQVKKLVLTKETLRTLAGEEFADVHGGSYFTTGCASRIMPCFNTEQASCRC
ncbi:MAG TPA: hypothetical protein VLB76_13955 [Thermoanaerobaculia bacterium]|jgi:hypothetical protein|nr:hypothetical protein [Thermoanaerobaculia bacterium]